jgi:hypothetical protein
MPQSVHPLIETRREQMFPVLPSRLGRRGKPWLLDLERRIPARDRFAPDSPLEGTGFEPSVP